MFEIIQFMIPAFVACLLLTAILAYFGLHVVSREVIFVDLALAQIAALGTTVAFAAGYGPQSTIAYNLPFMGHGSPLQVSHAYLFSLLFTFLGAAIFSLTRMKERRVPQEAIIGIVYAVSAAAALVAVDRVPGGAEHMKETLVGDILVVTWPQIGRTFLLCAFVGLFHLVFRKKFLLISSAPEQAQSQGLRIRLWDFLFYISFGLIITSVVRLAGVLSVFSFLIVPAVCALLVSNKIFARLLIGWSVGVVGSVIGLVTSIHFDLNPGAPIVCSLGVVLVFLATVRLAAATRARSTRPSVREELPAEEAAGQ